MQFEPLEDRRLLATLTVNSLSDVKLAGDGLVTLREAIIAANTNTVTDLGQTGSGADTIEFAAGLTGTISLLFGEMQITESLMVNGPGRDLVTIDAHQNSRIFNIIQVSSGIPRAHTFRGLTLTGGNVTSTGGAILSVAEDLILEQAAVFGNTAPSGGGIATAGRITLTSSIVSNNIATANNSTAGGGFSSGNSATITGSTISGNRATGQSSQGGGFHARNNVTLTDSVVSDNHAAGSGGGFELLPFPRGQAQGPTGHAMITSSTITGNSALRGGGFKVPWATITGSTVTGNQASEFGGGFYISYVQFSGTRHSLTLTGSTVSGNTAPSGGGGFRMRWSGTVNDSTISDNTGGGIWAYELTLNSSTVSGNRNTAAGGGVSASSLTMTASTVSGNHSDAAGGGISANGATLDSSTVIGNHSGLSGGGISSVFVTARSSTISGNSAGTSAGGINATGLTLESSTVSGNSAAAGAGGISSYNATIKHSTIFGNRANGGRAGGLWKDNGALQMVASVVAGNTASGGSPDLGHGVGALTVTFSLIGDNAGTTLAEAQTPDANGNLIGSAAGGGAIDPRLAPIADNGGPTPTHALLPGSPAIDAIVTSTGPPPAHDYPLNESLSDSAGGPSLVAMGGTVTSGGYDFNPNQGLSLSSALANPSQYSIELRFRWDSLSGGWQKIIDFHNLTSDVGLYTAANGLDFLSKAYTPNVFSGTSMHRVVLTRDDATDIVRGYVNGVEAWSFVDSIGVAVFDGPSQIMRFFQDDNASNQTEAQGGFVDYLRIYNQVLTAAQVAALETAPTLNPPQYDQRGMPFARQVDGDGLGGARIDMGAYESQGVPSFAPGDFNRNGIVDTADYVVWRKGLGAGTHSLDDYSVWRTNYGSVLVITPPAAGSVVAAAPARTGDAAEGASQLPATPAAVDFAFSRFAPTTPLSGPRALFGEASPSANISSSAESQAAEQLLLASAKLKKTQTIEEEFGAPFIGGEVENHVQILDSFGAPEFKSEATNGISRQWWDLRRQLERVR